LKKAQTKQNKAGGGLQIGSWGGLTDKVMVKVNKHENKELFKKKNSKNRMKLHRMS
tara:strand:+ start:417 stop:584 length:168 start_codon:yes stop_codon:yes gene_type:complete